MPSRGTPRIGTWTLDLVAMALRCSAACKANYGRAADEPFSYTDLAESIVESDRERWRATVEANLRNPDGFDVEYRARWRDGSLRDIQIRATYLPERPDTLMGISIDVTAHRHADEQFADAERRRRAVLAALDVASWTWSIAEDRVVADANMQRLFGVSAEAAAGGPIATYLARIHPDDRDGANALIQTALDRHESYEARYRVRGADGTYRMVVARGQAEYDEHGHPFQLPGVIVDISREIETEARYRTLFDTMEDGFCIIERIVRESDGVIDFRHIDMNPAFRAAVRPGGCTRPVDPRRGGRERRRAVGRDL